MTPRFQRNRHAIKKTRRLLSLLSHTHTRTHILGAPCKHLVFVLFRIINTVLVTSSSLKYETECIQAYSNTKHRHVRARTQTRTHRCTAGRSFPSITLLFLFPFLFGFSVKAQKTSGWKVRRSRLSGDVPAPRRAYRTLRTGTQTENRQYCREIEKKTLRNGETSSLSFCKNHSSVCWIFFLSFFLTLFKVVIIQYIDPPLLSKVHGCQVLFQSGYTRGCCILSVDD